LRVLHLTPELPYWPGGSGGSARQFHLLRRLVELGHEVTVAAPVTPAQRDRLRSLEQAGIDAIPYLRPESRVRETVRALCLEPGLAVQAVARPVLAWQVSVFWHSLRPLALGAIRERRPDVVVVEHDQAAAWARDLDPALPAVLVFDNLGWSYYDSRARAAGGLRGGALTLEAKRFRRFDAENARRYARLAAVSAGDAAALGWTGIPVDVIPNGVASDHITPSPEPAGRPTLVFTGTMAYHPNAEGILWFARRAWPQVVAAEPDTRLLVVGRDPPAEVRELAADARIEVTGAVDDVRPYLARAHVALVPLLSGGGTRLKLLEGMAAGRAVVTTRVGAEGVDVHHEREVLIEDAPERFADAVTRTIHDAELRRRLASAGRELAENNYDWRALGERFAATLELAAGRSTAAA